MTFNFPEILTDRSGAQQAQKVIDETDEFFKDIGNDNADKEAVDMLHAVETFIRVHFRGRMEVLDQLIEATVKKNTDRGYYCQKCH